MNFNFLQRQKTATEEKVEDFVSSSNTIFCSRTPSLTTSIIQSKKLMTKLRTGIQLKPGYVLTDHYDFSDHNNCNTPGALKAMGLS